MLVIEPTEEEIEKAEIIFQDMMDSFNKGITDFNGISVTEIVLIRSYINELLDLQILVNQKSFFKGD